MTALLACVAGFVIGFAIGTVFWLLVLGPLTAAIDRMDEKQ